MHVNILHLVSVRRGYTSFRCTLSFAMNYGSSDHFRILQLLIQAGASLNVSNHDELQQFLTFRKRKKRGLMSSYDVVQRMMKKEFDEVEKEIVCPLQVMKYLIQHNALLPKNWDKGECLSKRIKTFSNISKFLCSQSRFFPNLSTIRS